MRRVGLVLGIIAVVVLASILGWADDQGTSGAILSTPISWECQSGCCTSCLMPHDHTVIVGAVIAHAQEIAALLGGPPPEANRNRAVLEAALRVPSIDPGIKDKIQLVLCLLPVVEAGLKAYSVEHTEYLNATQALITIALYGVTTPAEAMKRLIYLLTDVVPRYLPNDSALKMSLAAGLAFLADGLTTIYSSARKGWDWGRTLQYDVMGAHIGVEVTHTWQGCVGVGVACSAGDALGQATGWW